jgi:hypothetical protein
VCGANGVTYGNACEAGCEGVDVVAEGACDEACACPTVYIPVCGEDGVTYGNACEAACADVEVVADGPCASDCLCADIYMPVCGVDGVTYGNACEAECAGVAVASPGECSAECNGNADCERGLVCDLDGAFCRPPCAIACLVPDPVCGEDGVTYVCGEEDAACNGVRVAFDGPCDVP